MARRQTAPPTREPARRQRTGVVQCGVLLLSLLGGCGSPPTGTAEKLGWPDLANYWFVASGMVEDDSLGEKVRRLAGHEVELTGYMVPLENARRHREFLLTSDASDSCSFCIGGGPESLLEVKAKEPIAFTYELLTVRGRLELLDNDPLGGLYSIVDAVPVP